jgi:transcriptional regulator with XRE-family HTH domain
MTTTRGVGRPGSGAQITRLLPPHTFILDGRRLRQLRHRRGLSQASLADRAEVSLTTIARLERQHDAACRGWTLGRLAQALGEPPLTMALRGPGISPVPSVKRAFSVDHRSSRMPIT